MLQITTDLSTLNVNECLALSALISVRLQELRPVAAAPKTEEPKDVPTPISKDAPVQFEEPTPLIPEAPKAKRGRPAKEVAVEQVDPTTPTASPSASASPTASTATASVQAAPTTETLRAGLTAFTIKHGMKAGIDLLADFECKKVTDLLDRPLEDQLEYLRLANA